MYAVTIPIIRTEQSTLLFDKRFALMNRGRISSIGWTMIWNTRAGGKNTSPF